MQAVRPALRRRRAPPLTPAGRDSTAERDGAERLPARDDVVAGRKAAYRTTMGLTGAPVPPTTFSGAAV
jgi:hypothetical protein